MDGNLLKEIHYLTRLIEQHKRKLPEKHDRNLFDQGVSSMKSEKCTNVIHRFQRSIEVSNESFNTTHAKCQVSSTNVHVNPNFKPCNPVIHINPKVRLNPLIHVNPRMIKDVTGTKETSEIKSANATSNFKENTVQTDMKRSVYVNPKLMKKLTSSAESKPVGNKQVVPQETIRPVCSRLKLVKGTSAIKVTPRKINNSSVVILSKRKLIRVRRASKGSSCSPPIGLCKVKKPLVSPFKKYKVSPQKVIRTKIVNAVQQSTSKDLNFAKLPAVKPKINKYRIDRTKSEVTKSKKCVPVISKKLTSNTMELITIGGVVYKSSKNQLVRRSYSLKRKRTSPKGDKFLITTNGKKLRRLKPMKDIQATNVAASINTATATKSLSNVSQRNNHKNYIINKVKQRSIQILRNKMCKNNQPCLIFQRFGYCANHEKGTCPKLHDKKQVALCKKFLQGNCLLDNCPLSHNVGPEKMPTCKYFLEGCCTRDSCPYRHVKVSSSTPICIEFLQGYCAKGHECKRRHEYLCPEFNKAGKCSKGKYCPYPHKSHSSTTKQADKFVKTKRDVPSNNNQVTPATTEDTLSSNHENRLRYYEQSDILTQDIDRKRENIMRKIQIMKSIDAAARSDQSTSLETPTEKNSTDLAESSESESELEIISETKVLKRPPIGSLPAYIPIN